MLRRLMGPIAASGLPVLASRTLGTITVHKAGHALVHKLHKLAFAGEPVQVRLDWDCPLCEAPVFVFGLDDDRWVEQRVHHFAVGFRCACSQWLTGEDFDSGVPEAQRTAQEPTEAEVDRYLVEVLGYIKPTS
jgi:hypothetical protein